MINNENKERLTLFYKENNILINKFFEIVKRKAVSFNDYNEDVFDEEVFDHELYVLLDKIPAKLKIKHVVEGKIGVDGLSVVEPVTIIKRFFTDEFRRWLKS